MSNILIIKHGSLGDIAQASGAIQDISENHKDDQIYLLTTKPYFDLFKKNPFIHEVILDKRLPRYNLIYLYFLMRELKKHNFSKVFDLQNSSRTNFYKNILFPKGDKTVWSSSITTLPNDKSKDEFDKSSVLERFDHQLKESGLNTSNTLKPDFNWASTDINKIKISGSRAPTPLSDHKIFKNQCVFDIVIFRIHFSLHGIFPYSFFPSWQFFVSPEPIFR